MQICLEKGIDTIVISPGSRNAPLIITFTNHPSFNNYSIVDERSAAFFALGMVQQHQRPVALVCTSGSALLNYYPAVAEAYYSDLPLIVISADRPEKLLEIGDGQTINQENVFNNHILYSANCKEGDEFQNENETEINNAINSAINNSGPVHINAPFSEPLYEMVDHIEVKPKIISLNNPSEVLDVDLDPYVQQWNSSMKKMILIGVMPPNQIEEELLERLAKDDSVIVLNETTSNLNHHSFFPSIDQLIAPLDGKGFQELQPDILLTFGGMIISKKIKAFLRNHPPKYHWHVDTKKAYDTFFVLNDHFKTSPNSFLNRFLSGVEHIESDYFQYWDTIRKKRLHHHASFLKKIPFSDFSVFSEIFKNIPNNYQVQLANSTTIRYSQLFELEESLKVFCNRGTSGIDGSLSTAIGAACSSNEDTVFITGDLSFFYDSNALWNNYIPKNFKIIVVNNSGGGIFRILPGAKNMAHFKTYFETKHNLDAEGLCRMYHFDYISANDASSLADGIDTLFNSSENPILLEVFTPSDLNDKILLDYFEYIR